MKENKNSKKSLRETIQFFLIDCKTFPGKLIDIFIIFLNILVCILFVIDTYPISESTREFLWKTETIIILFFIIEYTARLYGSRNRVKLRSALSSTAAEKCHETRCTT